MSETNNERGEHLWNWMCKCYKDLDEFDEPVSHWQLCEDYCQVMGIDEDEFPEWVMRLASSVMEKYGENITDGEEEGKVN